MAKFNYQEFQQVEQINNSANQVSFSGLKNNSDEAVVRFAFDSLNDLEFVTVHNVSVNGKYRKANCIRESLSDTVDKCPLCKAGVPLQQRVFLKMIQYDLDNRDSNGKPSYSAKVWERSATFAKTLQTYINEYGNLSDYVFKIVRHGNAGDMKTTYDIMPCMPQLYPSELYVKDFSAFNNYTVVGTIVIDEDFAGLQQIQNGTWQPKSAQHPTTPVGTTSSQTVTPSNIGYTTVSSSSDSFNQVENKPKRVYSY